MAAPLFLTHLWWNHRHRFSMNTMSGFLYLLGSVVPSLMNTTWRLLCSEVSGHSSHSWAQRFIWLGNLVHTWVNSQPDLQWLFSVLVSGKPLLMCEYEFPWKRSVCYFQFSSSTLSWTKSSFSSERVCLFSFNQNLSQHSHTVYSQADRFTVSLGYLSVFVATAIRGCVFVQMKRRGTEVCSSDVILPCKPHRISLDYL